MSYCQKCLDAIAGFINDLGVIQIKPEADISQIQRAVPESECEFWAHQAYNRVRNILKAGIEDMSKEILP